MATRHIVPRGPSEGGLGTEAKPWGETWSDTYNGGTVSESPTPQGIPKANAEGKVPLEWVDVNVSQTPADGSVPKASADGTIDPGYIPYTVQNTPAPQAVPQGNASGKIPPEWLDVVFSTAPGPGRIPRAAANGQLASGWVAGGGGGGGTGGGGGGESNEVELINFNDVIESSADVYEELIQYPFWGCKEWYVSPITVRLRRSGKGQCKITLSDGTHTAESEGVAWDGEGVDILSLDLWSLDNNKAWTMSVFLRGNNGTGVINQWNARVDKNEKMSPIIVGSGSDHDPHNVTVGSVGWHRVGGLKLRVPGYYEDLTRLELNASLTNPGQVKIVCDGHESIADCVAPGFSGSAVIPFHPEEDTLPDWKTVNVYLKTGGDPVFIRLWQVSLHNRY